MDSQLGGVLYSLVLRVACPIGGGGGSHFPWSGGVIFSMFGEVTCPMVGLGLKYLN